MNEPLRAQRDASENAEDTSTRNRILVATAEVLGRSGQTKLSLSEVALQAGVSRPTLYRWFADKGELLDAFGIYEREMFDTGIGKATAGLRGTEKLDAALSRRSISSQNPNSIGVTTPVSLTSTSATQATAENR